MGIKKHINISHVGYIMSKVKVCAFLEVIACISIYCHHVAFSRRGVHVCVKQDQTGRQRSADGSVRPLDSTADQVRGFHPLILFYFLHQQMWSEFVGSQTDDVFILQSIELFCVRPHVFFYSSTLCFCGSWSSVYLWNFLRPFRIQALVFPLLHFRA